jgi:hypothetical protein
MTGVLLSKLPGYRVVAVSGVSRADPLLAPGQTGLPTARPRLARFVGFSYGHGTAV